VGPGKPQAKTLKGVEERKEHIFGKTYHARGKKSKALCFEKGGTRCKRLETPKMGGAFDQNQKKREIALCLIRQGTTAIRIRRSSKIKEINQKEAVPNKGERTQNRKLTSKEKTWWVGPREPKKKQNRKEAARQKSCQKGRVAQAQRKLQMKKIIWTFRSGARTRKAANLGKMYWCRRRQSPLGRQTNLYKDVSIGGEG